MIPTDRMKNFPGLIKKEIFWRTHSIEAELRSLAEILGAEYEFTSLIVLDWSGHLSLTVTAHMPEEYFLTESGPKTIMTPTEYIELLSETDEDLPIEGTLRLTCKLSSENQQILRDLGKLKTSGPLPAPKRYEYINCGV